MIRQPNVILGNDKILVTMGKKGELFGFFYPRRDYAQHVEESLVCLQMDNRLMWTNNPEWYSTQHYLEDTNIVITELVHGTGIKINIQDFAHPTASVMVRKYTISTERDIGGTFFYFSNLCVGEMHKKNSAFCDPDVRLLAQYWQDNYIGIMASPPFEQWQVGKAIDTIWWTNARYDMEDGRLHNNKEDIGYLNTVVGWDLNLKAGQSREITVFIGAAPKRTQLYKMMLEIIQEPVNNMLENSRQDWINWLSKKDLIKLSLLDGMPETKQQVIEAFNRCLLTLDLLNDPKHGSFVSAPEFDHDFEMCGGYGYCWNRDVSEVAVALLNAGYPEYCERFFRWCRKTQLSDGSWFQRYWLDGNTAPSWGNFDHSTQIDETGATLHAMYTFYNTLKGLQKAEFLESVWITVLTGAEYLMKRTTEGLHEPCLDIWESYAGSFAYTSAAIYAGLKGAASLAKVYSEPGLASRWLERAEFVKNKTIEKMWLKEGYFAKCLADGKLDTTVDASIIGTFTPFNMFSPTDPKEREMIYSMLNMIENKLTVGVNGHHGIKRYENDRYIEGNPWIVTTLWLSKAMLTLANSLHNEPGTETEVSRLVQGSVNYIKWALKGTTSTGMLPEQVDKQKGHPAWAIPLGWSCALMIDNILLLETLSEGTEDGKI